MKRLAMFTLLLWGCLPAGAQSTPPAGILLDSYAALVNGKVITVGDVLVAMQPAQERLTAQYAGRELERKLQELYTTTREHLVDSELILLEFEKQGGALPDRALENHVNSVIHDQFNNDRTAFLKALADQRLTYTEWHKQIKEQFIVQLMRQKEVVAKILITPLDLQQAYDEQKATAFTTPARVQLRTLTLTGAARSQAADLRQRLLAGQLTFAAAAAEDIAAQDEPEWLATDSLAAPLRAALADLAPGDIAEPLELGEATYLVQLMAQEDAHTRPMDDVLPELERQVRNAQFDRLNQAWLESLRAKYYIKLYEHDL
ncbi:MAG TPA: peptidyl-prolyl cis-trans isomerase [Kiritimatiellia bacterium]|nr:peptidyl-prolyl cis-trans isomerase [Kiritimatiellia bacterium]HOU58952.1 peptidyl-prolyl cis-trans isomerase [Kiritimatiellia bacterium]HQF21176.1 peptidyl-prolyl cis-trans isomerase [Kiritimatiellia bacterium]HQG75188.1 peptidyl-prolyl cis-trans isomerase [Kiritimatiellia bacterium]HQK44448.1 peptidyl-prolyl cis-trans isomerase [Kiritimatiellia bacterium]